MPKAKRNGRDGIFMRRGNFYISFNDQTGRRVQRKVSASTLTQARDLRNAETARVEKARTLMGIEDFRLHDLRHTAASWLRMQGADIGTVADLLGHKDLRMAKRYQHLSPTYLQAAVRGLDTAFGPELAKMPALNAAAPETEQGTDHATITIEPKNLYEQIQANAS